MSAVSQARRARPFWLAKMSRRLLFAAHNLERAADRVTNIGERVIYAVTGRLEDMNIERPLSDQVDVNE